MNHVRYECKHGVVIRQCRCPNPSNVVRIVECPPTCIQEKETDNG
jgi:hypothetical protein